MHYIRVNVLFFTFALFNFDTNCSDCNLWRRYIGSLVNILELSDFDRIRVRNKIRIL